MTSTVLIATSATLVLAACGGTAASSSSNSSSGVVNVTWQTMWSGNTLTLLNQMVSAFNSSHPGIHVTESNIPSATGDAKLLSEIAAGDPPDVFTEWNPVLGEYAADGTIQSLTPYLTGKYAGLEKWEYPIALQGGQYKGTLYALPMSMNSWALYYNKSMLKAAGISSPPTTAAELYADLASETGPVFGGASGALEGRSGAVIDSLDVTSDAAADAASAVAYAAAAPANVLSGTLTFTGVRAPRAGTYRVILSYASNDRAESGNYNVNLIDPGFSVTTSAGTRLTMHARNTYSWNQFNTVGLTVQLAAGENTIMFGNPLGRAPSMDKIIVAPASLP